MPLNYQTLTLSDNDIFDLNGCLIQVSDLHRDICRFLQNLEHNFTEEDRGSWGSEIKSIYQTEDTYFVPIDDEDTGLPCQLLDPKTQQWHEGEFSIQPLLSFEHDSLQPYEINSIDYTPDTMIKIGNLTFEAKTLLNTFLKYLYSCEDAMARAVSEEFQKFISTSPKKLFHPEIVNSCLDAQILKPGQGWQDCKLDLTLMLRLYTLKEPVYSPQLIYQNSNLNPSVYSLTFDRILQINSALFTIESILKKAQILLKIYERKAKQSPTDEYYDRVTTLRKAPVHEIHKRDQVYLITPQQGQVGLPCRVLQLKTEQWLEGTLQVQLIPQFKPDTPIASSAGTNVDNSGSSRVDSLLDDIRQAMNPSAE